MRRAASFAGSAALAAAFTFVTAPGAESAGRVTVHNRIGGRSYLLRYDPAETAARPLVIALHTAQHGAHHMERVSGLTPFSDRHRFHLAYGGGRGGYWNAGTCCGGSTADDVRYLEQVVEDVASRVPVDRSRVYVVGVSNGGMMAYRAVCDAPEVFAAAAVVSGTLVTECSQARVGVIQFHGLRDATVPFTGGTGYQSASFPPAWSNLLRVGAGSTIILKPHTGGHDVYPGDANRILWPFLNRFTSGGSP